MAWTTPSTAVAGSVLPASLWNSDVRDNSLTLRAGGLNLASQSARDFIYASTSTQLGRLGGFAALQVPRMNAGVTAWEAAYPEVTRLAAGSGSTSTTTSQNVATVSITGLTDVDTLVIKAAATSVTQATAAPQFSDSDNNISHGWMYDPDSTATIPSGTARSIHLELRQAAADPMQVLSTMHLNFGDADGLTGMKAMVKRTVLPTIAWTGTWTLAFSHNGVTSGGTFYWNWTVYRMRGQ